MSRITRAQHARTKPRRRHYLRLGVMPLTLEIVGLTIRPKEHA